MRICFVQKYIILHSICNFNSLYIHLAQCVTNLIGYEDTELASVKFLLSIQHSFNTTYYYDNVSSRNQISENTTIGPEKNQASKKHTLQ